MRTKSVLFFHIRCVLAQKIPNAFIKTDNRRGEEQCVLVDKGKQEGLSVIESGCTGGLTGSSWRRKW